MSAHSETDPRDLALARIRVALADIAPEIPEDDIVPSASLRDDLRLDEVSVWALVTNLESLAKVRIRDADAEAARSVDDMIDLAVGDTDVSPKPAKAEEASDDDVMAAASDLASLFNNN